MFPSSKAPSFSIDPDSDSSVDGSRDELIKDQDNLYVQGKEVVSAPRRIPRSIIWGDQIALRDLKR